MTKSIMQEWCDLCTSAGLPYMSFETCCQLMAVLYYAATEDFTLNKKVQRDAQYAQERLHIKGGETPLPEAVERIKELCQEIERSPRVDTDTQVFPKVQWPDWAVELAKKRYGLKLPSTLI